MSKKVKILSAVLILLTSVLIVLWQIFWAENTSYYIVSAVILLLSLVPFFAEFERSKPSAREMALLSVLIALAVASRAVFYLIPQFKPIGAVAIASAVCLGASRGYIVGAFSAFVSNFIFGQGLFTPFQMVALGLVGFISGLIFDKIKVNRVNLAVIGFALTSVFYGIIVDTSSVLTMVNDYNFASVLAVYAAGVPFSLIFGGATALFLFLFGEPFIKKIKRIVVKYDINQKMENGDIYG